MGKADTYASDHGERLNVFKAFIKPFLLAYICLITVAMLLLSLPGNFSTPPGFASLLSISIYTSTLTGFDLQLVAESITMQGHGGIPMHGYEGITMQGHLCILIIFQAGAALIMGAAMYAAALLGITKPPLLPQVKKTSLWRYSVKALLFLLVLEIILSAACYMFWRSMIPGSTAKVLFYTFYHTASMFCHAGYTLLYGGFSGSEAHIMLILLAVVLLGGGMGYPVFSDIFSVKRLRTRLADPEKGWVRQTMVSFYLQVAFFALGAMIFYFALRPNFYLDLKNSEAICSSIFQSAGAFNTGVYTTAPGSLPIGLWVLYTVLMLAGTGAVSPGGGLKASAVYALIKGGTEKNKWLSTLAYATKRTLLLFIGLVATGTVIFLAFAPQTGIFSAIFSVVSTLTNTGILAHPFVLLHTDIQLVLAIFSITGRIGIPLSMLYFISRKGTRPENTENALLPF